MQRRVVFSLLVAAILCATLARFQNAASTVPSYVAFDMDLVITIDSFLMGSGHIPDNLSHPGFGLNLILTKTQAIAYAMGGLGARDIADLRNALNPLLPSIEMTAFNRAHSPFIALSIVAFLWSALCIGLRWPPWLAILALLSLAGQQGLIYQAMGVRSEVYALFYWSLGMLAVAMAGRARGMKATLLWAGVAGLALGIAFLTKVQVLLYLLGAGLFLYYLLQSHPRVRQSFPQGLGVKLSTASLVLYLLGLWGAWAVQPTRGSGTFASGFTLTPPALAVLTLMVALVAVQKQTRRLENLLVPTSALVLGFVLSAAAHLVMFRDLSTSWRYLFLDLKIVYLRPDFYGGQEFQTFTGYGARFLTVASQDPALIATLIGLLSLNLWLHRSDRAKVALLSSLGGTALMAIAVGSRDVPHDWVWVELFPTAVTLLAAGLLVARKGRLRYLAGAAILVLALSNILLATTMPRRYRDAQATYGYRPWRFSHALLAASYHLYTDPFDLRYQKAGWPAFSASVIQMTQLPQVLMMADAATGRADVLSLGPAVVGLPVWRDLPGWRLTEVTSDLSRALVINPVVGAPLAVRMRLDLAIFLLLDSSHYQALTGRAPEPKGERLELSDGTATRALYPIRVEKATDFSPQQLGESALVLVRPLLDLPNPVLPPEPKW